MAQKLVFKSFKSHLFKNNDAWAPFNENKTYNDSTATSDGDGETTTTTASTVTHISNSSIILLQAMESKPEHRCFLYLNSFERISFEWDTTCRSSHLEQLQSVS